MGDIYQHDSYHEILRAELLAKKAAFGRAYTFDKMARACKVQRTYLSAVLAGRGHLNGDQLFLACTFLAIDGAARRFTGLLHEHERSSCAPRRKTLAAEAKDDQHSFAVLYSARDDTRGKIQKRFLELVEWAESLTQGSEPTGVYQMSFDLLRWG